MKKLSVLFAAAVLVSAVSVTKAADDGNQLILDLGDAVTLGNFKYKDVKIEVEKEYANPRGSAEFKFGGTPASIGVEFAQSKNTFTGTYEDSHGSVDVKRNEMAAYLRLGHKDETNVRIGYRKFKYDFSNADIVMDNGEHDKNGEATGDLTTGLDAEVTLAVGTEVQFALTVGGTYFKDAKYSWAYDKYINERFTGHVTGNAKLDALSVRIRPQLSMKMDDNIKIYINGTIAASSWDATPEGGADYAGVDIYTALGLGLQYTFDL
ncbi:MAG: hypothetical protein C0404_14750 [Verrucomicrobia bacterium]|nr:hypothetical protein [Verrucomicrobiota bacterium]